MIPELDISLFPHHLNTLSSQLNTACTQTGFFHVVNHGIPPSLIQQTIRYSQLFFNLPQPVKDTYSTIHNSINRGYTRLLEEKLGPSDVMSLGDTKEGFYIGKELPTTDTRKFHGPNVWPKEEDQRQRGEENLLQGFRTTMQEYWAQCHQLSMIIVNVLSHALTGDIHTFDQLGWVKEPMAFVRLLHYAAIKSSIEHGVYACGEHSDYGLITLLYTTDPGLEVFTKENQWVRVDPKPNAFIVNIGDMTELISGGRYKSTKHRVINLDGKERYSVPFFFDPDHDAMIRALQPPLGKQYEQVITAAEYLDNKYKQTHSDYADTVP